MHQRCAVLWQALLVSVLLVAACHQSPNRAEELPILDMHLHAHGAEWSTDPLPVSLCVPLTLSGPACPRVIWSPATSDEILEQTVAVVNRRNIIGALSSRSPERLRRWVNAAPTRFIPALMFDLVRNPEVTPELVRRLVQDGTIKMLGEVTNQYVGIAPNDDRMEPFWALAADLDIPIAVHLGEGYPGAPYRGDPDYRVRLGDPLTLEGVLVRHPRLRVYVMHFGSPFVAEMIALLYTYPNVYVDLGGMQWTYPRPYFYAQLKQLVDAGLGDRVMFGSDQMIWPDVIEPAVAVIEEAPFLSEEQKRDIFYNNAARFLRLSEKDIARHHGRSTAGASK